MVHLLYFKQNSFPFVIFPIIVPIWYFHQLLLHCFHMRPFLFTSLFILDQQGLSPTCVLHCLIIYYLRHNFFFGIMISATIIERLISVYNWLHIVAIIKYCKTQHKWSRLQSLVNTSGSCWSRSENRKLSIVVNSGGKLGHFPSLATSSSSSL